MEVYEGGAVNEGDIVQLFQFTFPSSFIMAVPIADEPTPSCLAISAMGITIPLRKKRGFLPLTPDSFLLRPPRRSSVFLVSDSSQIYFITPPTPSFPLLFLFQGEYTNLLKRLDNVPLDGIPKLNQFLPHVRKEPAENLGVLVFLIP
jgi:hypothetical protein